MVQDQTPVSTDVSTVVGPVRGGLHGRAFSCYFGDIDALGYVEEEWFLEGNAKRYSPLGDLSSEGTWTVTPAGVAPFRTRMLVRRPRDPAKFNGTLVVEWINVTSGFELTTIGALSTGIYDSGFAYATVSCQTVGLKGFAKHPQGLRQWDPDRYGSLSIASDAYSYDIFTQAGRALRVAGARRGQDPMQGLDVRKTIAVGASQSAIRLRTYINAIQPTEHVFDAIITALDFGTAADFGDRVFDPTVLSPGDTGPLFETHSRIRCDNTTPVLVVNSEFEALRFLPSRQPDNDYFRFWEIAGASHVPAPQARHLARLYRRDGLSVQPEVTSGSEVMWQPTADAALDHVHRWIHGGSPPPLQPRIEISEGSKPEIVRDSYGNAMGGARLPELEVPIASYSGTGRGPALLYGTTTPLPQETLRKLYSSPEAYADQIAAAAASAERSGLITTSRRREYVEMARIAEF